MDANELKKISIKGKQRTAKKEILIQKLEQKLQYRDKLIDEIKSKADKSKSTKLLKNILDARESGPQYICFCCCGLFFKHSVSKKGIADTQLHIKSFHLVHRHSSSFICRYCWGYIKRGTIPNKVYDDNLKYVDLPDCLKELTSLEARICSPIINFMKIVELKPKSSFSRQCRAYSCGNYQHAFYFASKI